MYHPHRRTTLITLIRLVISKPYLAESGFVPMQVATVTHQFLTVDTIVAEHTLMLGGGRGFGVVLCVVSVAAAAAGVCGGRVEDRGLGIMVVGVIVIVSVGAGVGPSLFVVLFVMAAATITASDCLFLFLFLNLYLVVVVGLCLARLVTSLVCFLFLLEEFRRLSG